MLYALFARQDVCACEHACVPVCAWVHTHIVAYQWLRDMLAYLLTYWVFARCHRASLLHHYYRT